MIAHEWAHSIQAQLPDRFVSPAVELQADCLAGASLEGAAREGLVQIEPGDTDEIAQALQAIADDYPWTDESSHGNARERTAAFQAGVDERRRGLPARVRATGPCTGLLCAGDRLVPRPAGVPDRSRA